MTTIGTAKNGKQYIEIAASRAGTYSTFASAPYDYRIDAALDIDGTCFRVTGFGSEYKSGNKTVCRMYVQEIQAA